jgi:hypothetical protein
LNGNHLMRQRLSLPPDHYPDDFDSAAYRAYRPHYRAGVGLWLRQTLPQLLLASLFVVAIGGGFMGALLILPPRAPQVVIIQATATPVGDLRGDFPPDVAQLSITLPAKIDNWMDLGQRRGYRFFAKPGLRWLITVLPDAAFNPQVTLFNPDGSVAQINNDRAPGERTSELIFEASETAQYAILVESAERGSTAGGYTLEIMPLNE